MKKSMFLIVFTNLAFAEENYARYIDKIINYHYEIRNLNNIRTPFYEPIKCDFVKNRITKIKISLLSIFENKAYVKIERYYAQKLISATKKWINVKEKINNCELLKLNNTDAIFKCNDKILYKTTNKEIFLKVK